MKLRILPVLAAAMLLAHAPAWADPNTPGGGGGSGGGGGGDASAANQTSGAQKTQIVDPSGNAVHTTSNNLNVQCANCTGSGVSATDGASFTAGSSLLAPAGGFFQTTPTTEALTTGEQGMVQMTANRAFHNNLRNAAGTEIGTASTPLQVSVANTGANATPLLVSGAGQTFPITAAALPLPSGAASAAHQTDATQKTQIVDGSGNVIASTSNNLDVQCANCSGSGVSTADKATFTPGASLFAGTGGFFQTTPTANPLTNGQQGFFQVTAQRSLFSNLRNASGTEIGTASTPVQVSIANTGANGTAMLVTGAGGAFPITAAAGAYVAGAFVAGSAVDGWNITEGAKSDAAWASGSGSIVAIAKTIAGNAAGTTAAVNSNAVTIPLPIAPYQITWTQTKVTLTAATSTTLIASNTARRALRWMNTGSNPVTVAPGAVTVTAGDGMNYNPGTGIGQQGGADSFGVNEVSMDAFSAISTLGTTVIVWEGQ